MKPAAPAGGTQKWPYYRYLSSSSPYSEPAHNTTLSENVRHGETSWFESNYILVAIMLFAVSTLCLVAIITKVRRYITRTLNVQSQSQQEQPFQMRKIAPSLNPSKFFSRAEPKKPLLRPGRSSATALSVAADETKCLLPKDVENNVVGDGDGESSRYRPYGVQPITPHVSASINGSNSWPSSSAGTTVTDREISLQPATTTTSTAATVAKSLRKVSDHFQAQDLANGNDTELLSKFNFMMSMGMEVFLRTVKGPKPIVLTLIGSEIRWQAASKSASKRFKLKLVDVMSVQPGKQMGNFITVPDPLLREELCFSLVTQKTTLDLQLKSKLDRDSLVRGFQLQLDAVRNSTTI